MVDHSSIPGITGAKPSGQRYLLFCSPCRCFSVFALYVVVSVLLVNAPAKAQPQDDQGNPQVGELLLLMERTKTSIAESNWSEAVDAFDSAWASVCNSEDPILNLNRNRVERIQAGQHETHAGARTRLEQLFMQAPAEFRSEYSDQLQPRAINAMKSAIEAGSVRQLEATIDRYVFTRAAGSGLQSLLRLRESRGEFLEAALQWNRFRRITGLSTPESRMRSAMLWWLGGASEDAVDELRSLARLAGGNAISVAGRKLTIPTPDDNLTSWLSENFHSSGRQTEFWGQPDGNARRAAIESLGPSVPEQKWTASVFASEMAEIINPEFTSLLQQLAADVHRRSGQELQLGNTVLPVSTPVIVDDLLIYRGIANLRAVNRLTGERVWESGGVDRELNGAAEKWAELSEENGIARDYIRAELVPRLFHHLVRTNVAGQLSTDGNLVYAIEETSAATWQMDLGDSAPRDSPGLANYLRVYDARTGILRGQAGGSRSSGNLTGPVNPLRGMYFLGAPLVLGSRIYVLAESGQGIFLLQLSASSLHPEIAGAELDLRPERSQLLFDPTFPLEQHPVRKYCGIMPSFAHGLLICGTSDEHIVAVSAEDHSVRWIYRYEGNVSTVEMGGQFPVLRNGINYESSRLVDLRSRWVNSAPVIHNGRIFLTPRDSDRLICLDLETGRELWTRPRGTNHSVAAAREDKIVLVGRAGVAALDPVDGRTLWSTALDGGFVCGNAATSETALQIPMSSRSIVTVSLKDGRQLLSQPMPSGETPGNLIAMAGDIYSQSLTQVVRMGPQHQPDELIAGINGSLLNGDVAQATDLLTKAVDDSNVSEPRNQALRRVLIDTLLESLRIDYVTNSGQIPRIQKLISESSTPDHQITELLQSMLGMLPGDAVLLTSQWDRADETRRQLDRLYELASQGLPADADRPPPELAQRIVELLDSAFAGRNRYLTSGQLMRRGHRSAAAMIRSVLSAKAASEQRAIERELAGALADRLQSAGSGEETVWWLQTLDLCGLQRPVLPLLYQRDVSLPEKFGPLIRSRLFSLALNLKEGDIPHTALLDLWREAEMELSVRSVLDKSAAARDQPLKISETHTSGGHTDFLRDFSVLSEAAIDSVLEWKQQHAADREVEETPWQGEPRVVESPARTGPVDLSGAPRLNIPLYGSPGAFDGWCFTQPVASNKIDARDSMGRLRWTFDPGQLFSRPMDRYASGFNKVSSQYVLAYGHMLAMKLQDMLFVLDASRATALTAPTLLWELNLSTNLAQSSPAQQFARGWQRTTQYAMEPAGLFPCGPLTAFGFPVYSGRELVVFHPLTGEREWQVEGLPDDCTMTGDDETLLLLSESEGQIETRSMIDGSVLQQTTLPAWWTDANENSDTSIRAFDAEPGRDFRWRIAVTDAQCLLFRLNDRQAALERFDLRSKQNSWSVPLSRDSVFSNMAEGVVAILSDGTELRLIRVIDGVTLAVMQVPEAKNCRTLYLRPSGGHWVVLTDIFDPAADFVAPQQTDPVNGWAYGIDRKSLQLSWSQPTDHENIRVLTPEQSPIVPVAPLLVLVQNKPMGTFPGTNIPRPRPATRILDTRTGKVLYASTQIGQQFNYHMLRFDDSARTIEVGFEIRSVMFHYGPSDAPESDTPESDSTDNE